MNMDFLEKVMLGIGVFFTAVVVAFLLTLIFAYPVMLLWNWLMPTMFNLCRVDFWQAWGLALLCNLLFKGSTTTKSKAD